MRIEGVILEYHSHTSAFRWYLGNIIVTEKYLTLGRFLKSAYHIEHCTFSASGRSEKCHKRSVRDHKSEVLNSGNTFSLPAPGRKDLGKSV